VNTTTGVGTLVGAISAITREITAGSSETQTGASCPQLSLTFSSPNSQVSGTFGFSVSGVADTNGDGVPDLLVGAYKEDAGATDAGRAYLFSGATGALLRTLASPNPEVNAWFGYEVSGVPDVNGDGRGDLLVGAAFEDAGASDAGRAYLFSGATGALLRTLASPTPEPGGEFGRAVAGVPDANGDGWGDLLIGAHAEDGGAPFAGRAYLFSGATGALLRTLISPNAETDGNFGDAVAGVPDADGDGLGDLLVSANREDGGATDAGRAYLFSGATGALLSTLTSPNPETDPYNFGRSVSGVPDVNGDGRGDLLVGAYLEDGGASNAGRAYLFSGATGALLCTFASPNPEAGGEFGRAVAGVPDTDGDGLGDLLIGADFEDGGTLNAGRAYLFNGAGAPPPCPIAFNGAVTATFTSSPRRVTFAGRVVNTGPGARSIRIEVDYARVGGGPSGTLSYGPANLPQTGPSGVAFSINQPVPGAAPPGTYSLTIRLIDHTTTTVCDTRTTSVAITAPRVGQGDPNAAWVAVEVPGLFATGMTAPAGAVASPNPFAGQAAIQYVLAEASDVRLAVYDVLGREVAVLVDGYVEAGAHHAVFDARGLASGTYVYRFAVGDAVETGRLTLVH
jgi:hypothetical protein